MKIMRRLRQPLSLLLTLLLVTWQITPRAYAATITWNAGSGTNFLWGDVLNWDLGTFPSALDDVVLVSPIPNPGPQANPQIITLGAVSLANSLRLDGNYTLSGGDLTLTGGGIRVALGSYSVIDAELKGTTGLNLAGGGTVRLANASNSYSAVTTISNGSVVVSNQTALGTGTSAVVVSGSATRGFGGGSLVLDGSAAGITFTRDLSLQGLGPITDRSGALVSIGNNTVSGTVNSATGAINTRLLSSSGLLTLSGTFNAQGTAVTTFSIFGGVNQAGTGSYNLTGTLTGTGSIEKNGGGTLHLNPSNVAGFGGSIRVTSNSAAGTQGTIRITNPNVIGTRTANAANSVIDLNAGFLEVRMNAPTLQTSTATNANVYSRSGTNSTLFLDHGLGSALINETLTLGEFGYAAGALTTFTSRNGYNITFGAAPVVTGDNNNTITNSLAGTLTFTGNLWSNTNNAAARTMTIAGNGNTIISGNVVASSAAFDHVLTKQGTGTLQISSVGSTLDGAVNVQTGTLQITDFRSITNNTSAVNLGSNAGNNTAATSGTLQIGTGVAATAAGLTTPKAITLVGSIGGGIINASQSVAFPVILGALGSTAQGTASYTLGGTSIENNIVNGVISNSTVSGTTQLTGNAASGATTLTLGSVDGIAIGATISGTNIPAATTVTAINPTTRVVTIIGAGLSAAVNGGATITVAGVTNLTGVTKADGGTWVLAGANTYTGATNVLQGILKLKANAGASTIVADASAISLGVASNVQNSGGTLELVGVSGVATTEALGALTPLTGANSVVLTSGGGGAAANLTFSSLGTVGAGTGVNFVTTAGGGGTVTLTGLATSTATTLPGNGKMYLNGANFARSNAGVLVAPVYGTDTGFVNAAAGAATLSAASHNNVTGNITAQTALTVSSLRLSGQTLTLTGALVVNTGGVANDGGILATGGTSTITGSTVSTGGAGGLVFRVNGASDVLNLGSQMLAATTGGLTKNGLGTLVLSGNNLQVGTININEGTVRLSGTGRLSGASQTLNLRASATLDLNGLSTGTAINTLNGAGTVTNTSTTSATFNWGNSTTGNGTFSGIIQDGAGVVNVSKGGSTSAGTFTGLSTYTGVTTIAGSSGNMSVINLANIGVASSIGRGNATSTATNQASLVFAGTTGALNYTGTTSVSTDRLFTLNGSAANSGGQIANSSGNNSTLIFSNTGPIAFGTGATVAQVLTLGGVSTGDSLFNPQINDNADLRTSLSKIGAGVWMLGNAANGYTGNTTITAGLLGAASGTNLPTNSPLVFGGGVLLTSGNFTRNLVATATPGNANEVAWTTGGGFAANESKLNVSIGGVGTETALTWASGGFVANAQPLILSGATALSEVEFRNSIDLNGAVRSVQVDDNGNTGADFATMSGVLSGVAGGLNKTGGGILVLTGSNSYGGTTTITQGTLVVSSLGNSAVAGNTSIGTATGANLAAQALILGRTGNNAGLLQYVGPGETSDRFVQLGVDSGTGSSQIHADGAGPLVLTNVNNTANTAAKTLFLRGSNTSGNMITSQLSDNTGALSLTVDGGATWILSNAANNYSGTTNVTAGALGIGAGTALGTGTLSGGGSSIFAHGGDRAIANAFTHPNNITQAFIGDYSLAINGSYTNASSANSNVITNTIVSGKTLTLGNITNNAMTAARSLTFNGTGDTIVSGNITTTTAFDLGLVYSGTGSLTLGGGASDLNTGLITVSSGTLKLGASEVIPHGFAAQSTATATVSSTANTVAVTVANSAGLVVGQQVTGAGVVAGTTVASIVDANNITLSVPGTNPATNIPLSTLLTFNGTGNVTLSPAAATTATLNLNGNSETINGMTDNSAGNIVIDNTAAVAATLTFGASNAAVTIGGGTGTATITDSGAGALSIIKTGTAAGTIGAGTTLTYQGTTGVTGGSLTVSVPLNGTTGLSVLNAGSSLAIPGGLSAPGVITSVNVGNGATLNLFDGAGSKINALTNLTLGTAAGTNTILNLNVGDSLTAGDGLNTDTLALAIGGALNLFAGNKVTFNLTDTGLNANQSYTLLDATAISGGFLTGPLTLADYVLGGTPGGFTSISLSTSTNNLIILNTGNLITGPSYFTGQTNNTWNGSANNWADDKAGTIASTTTPGQGTVVIFRADNAVTPTLATTLEQNFKINSLTFEASTNPVNTPTSISIAPGTVATNRLELAPQLPTAGLNVQAGATPLVTISAPVRATGNQTWSVADAATLTGATYATASTTVNVASTTGLSVGMTVAGPGIPAGATVVSISVGSFVISAATTAAAATAVTVNATSLVSMTGGLSGAGNLTKDGAGKVAVSGSGAYTGTLFTMNAGQFEFSSGTTLGGIVATPGAGALVELAGGIFYVNNATSTTVSNNLILSGGTLSAGGNNHTYSGSVTLNGNSGVNLLDPLTLANGRTITLSGVLSGTAGLTLDSIATSTAGNAETGTLTINNGSSTWNGPLSLTRGTAVFTNAAGGGTLTPFVGFDGIINFNQFGRVIYRNVDGASLDRTAAINFAAGALGEFSVDNLATTLASNYTVTQSGVITLGTGATARFSLADAASNLNITGGVVLNGNSSISVEGGDADSLVSINTTGISGTGNLAINDEAGAWATTSTRLAINAAGTFIGNTTLNEGTLILGHKDALSNGSLTITGASTLQAGVDLSGANAFPNATTLSASITLSGVNNFTFASALTQSGGDRTLTNSLTTPAALIINELRLAEAASAASRNLTLAGTGATTIANLVNNDQNNTLTNSLTTVTLNIGTIALSENAATGRALTLGGAGTTTVTGLIENIAGGGGIAGALNKTGTGILTLQGANTFSGDVTVTAGILDFSAVSNIGGPASNLGRGSNISLGGGTLRFIGGTSQTTNRPISLTASSTLTANGTSGATMTYTGAVAGGASSLTLDGTGEGFLNAALTQTAGGTNDINKNGVGTWTLNATSTVADDILVNAGTLNINATQAVNDDITITNAGTIVNINVANAHQGDDLFIRNGAVVNLGVNGALGTGMDALNIAENAAAAATATLDLKGFTSTVPTATTIGFENSAVGEIVSSVGNGVLTSGSYTVRNGSVAPSVTLAGAGGVTKNGAGVFTLSSTNSFTGASVVTEGQLVLDYSTNNTSKIAAAAGLTIGGAAADENPTLTINGNSSAATTQAFTVLTLSQASGNLVVISNGGQAANLNFTTITRNIGATLDLTLPAVGSVTTTQPLTNGSVGGYFTLGNGASFATKDGANAIQPLVPTTKNDVTTWALADNVTDGGTGFTGTATGITGVNSLTYSGVAAAVNSAGVIGLNSGGILVTSTSTGSSLTGGVLTSGLFDVVVHQYAAGDFTLASAIRGANAITKTGSGALVLSGTNTANGAVNITEGLVKASGGSAIGDTATVSFKDVAGSGLQLLTSETVGNISGGGTTGGGIALGNNTLTINATATATYSGLITGGASSALVRNGSSGVGNLLLTGASGAGFIGTVTINGGLFYLEGLGSLDASSITVNKGGSFLISNNGTTRSAARLPDTASIILNSADGAWNTETRPSGLSVRTDQNATTSETIGALSFASGASYFRGDASGTTGIAGILASNFTRANNATLDARGRALGGSTGDRNQLRIADATNQTAFISTLVGGGGAAGTKNVSIVPWMFGESTAAGLADANMGNSLVTYVSGAGVRPLDLATEYNTFGGAPVATDNIRESLAADLTSLAGATINSLVVNNSNTASGSVNIVGTGAGQTLAVTSGTMLFTATAAVTGTPAMGLSLGGFDAGITVGGTNEYVVFVQNPTSAAAGGTVMATISSPLTSTADITKSGRGVLVLSGTNTAGGATKKTTINEGTLEISSLANIGGATGNLVFAGGTLRLGTTLTDDISTRTIRFLQGGGSIDTNGINLTLANSIGAGSTGSLTKTGAGNLTVNAAMTHTGGTIVANGKLAAGIANMVPVTSNLTVNGAAAILDLGGFNQTVNTFTLGNGTVNGTATVTAFDYQLQAGTVSGTVVLSGANASVGITKTTAGTVVLSGAHTFTGPVVIQAGFLSVDQIADANGTPSSLGAQANVIDGALQIGLGANTAGISYTGSGQTANRQIALTGTTGSATIAASGTGALDWAGAVTSVEFGAKALVLRGTSASGIVNKLTAGITETLGSAGIQKLDSNVWQIDTASNYTGPTQIDEGTLRIGANNILPATTAIRLGNGTTAGVFDLNGFDQTIGSLTASTNSTNATNQILVSTGKTLTINGAVTLGANVDASTTLVTASGGGSMVVNSADANFQVGGATGGTNENTATVDFGGLSSFTANLGAGTFRVGDANTASGTAAPATMKLAVTNMITAAAIRVGDGSGFGNNHTLTLGSGGNTLNADTFNVGSAGVNLRSSGTVNFDAGDTTGAVVIRGSAGGSTPVANFNLVNSTGNTTAVMDATVNLAGHTADISATSMVMASRTTSTGSTTSSFTFDQGSLQIGTLNMASRTGAGTGAATATVTLGDSAAPGSPTTTIGTVNMAVNTSAGGTVTSSMIITGGTVNIGTGSGTAINMANAAASRTAVSTINLTGGTLSATGNIVRTGGAGTETATITVNGGSLNMNGNSIGTAGAPITLQAQFGMLTNLAQFNGGGTLTKSTTGTLSMGDGNTYTGGTLVSDGTLLATNSTGSATGSGAVTVAAAGTLGGTGSIIAGPNNNITIDGILNAGMPSSTTGTALALTVGGTGQLQFNGTTVFDLFANTAGVNLPTSNDRVVVNAPAGANIIFGASSILQISTTLAPTAYANGDTWQLFDWSGVAGGVTGGFASINLPVIDPGFSWDTANLYSLGVVSIIAVPEPSRALLMLLGLLGLMMRRRRN